MLHNPSRIHFTITAGAAIWVAAILAPAIASWAGLSAFAGALRNLFAPACHQLISRSFLFYGSPLAVCARCTGIYAGALVGLFGIRALQRVGRTDTPTRWLLITGAVPCASEFLLGHAGLFLSTNLYRFATGFVLGATAAFFVYPGLLSFFSRLSRRYERIRQLA